LAYGAPGKGATNGSIVAQQAFMGQGD